MDNSLDTLKKNLKKQFDEKTFFISALNKERRSEGMVTLTLNDIKSP